ncbi:VOC family protein [Filobacillus milosensis]|nr:VOC family protein [Filobacillus milosensis]
MLNQVCVMTIRVPNTEHAVKFYTEILGFEVDQYYGDTIVSLKHDQIPLILEEHSEVINGQNNVVLAIQSEDLEQDIEALTQAGVKFIINKPEACPPGRYAVIEDPFGNQIELLEFSKVK